MTKEQLQILQHSLGVDQYAQGNMYRNHYVTDNDAEMEPLVALGYMRCDGRNAATGGMNCYRVTDIGRLAMREESPKPPKLTQSQKRYREWLKIGDALNCSFGEWLKMRKEPWYKEMEAKG